MSAASERVFLSENDIIVSNTRFVVPPQLFALANIVSVSFNQKAPNRLWPILLVFIGLGLLVGGQANIFSLALPFLAGIIWLSLQKTHYLVVLSGSSGETKALDSTNKEFVGRVVSALTKQS